MRSTIPLHVNYATFQLEFCNLYFHKGKARDHDSSLLSAHYIRINKITYLDQPTQIVFFYYKNIPSGISRLYSLPTVVRNPI